MPELPEVETMVRGIRDAMVGRRVDRLRRCPCRCKPLSLRPGWRTMVRRIVGRTIRDVRRRAKRILIEFDDHSVQVIEPRMTGLMLLSDPPDRQHLRCEWRLAGPPSRTAASPTSVWYWDRRGLGTVSLLTAEEVAGELGPQRIGPDALEMTPELWRERLGRTQRPIKVALLDQQLVAGIGNLYASEILHAARIDPRRPASSLSVSDLQRMTHATRTVLQTAIFYEGSTLSDGTYRNALNRNGRYQNEHRVYARAEAPCPTCQTPIRRIVQAQRSTFYCPACQSGH